MKLIGFGLNHVKTPIEIREKFCLSVDEQELLLDRLKAQTSIHGAFVLSTCNRIEIYADVADGCDYVAILFDALFQIKKVRRCANMESYFYFYKDAETLTHLLSVSCGLDSLVIGEKQILGQIKMAIALAREKTFLNKSLNILTNLAIQTGKKVRRETDIGLGGTSVAWASVIMMEREMGNLQRSSVLIIGAGKMGEITGKQLKSKNIQKVTIANRTEENAVQLAKTLGAKVIPFADIQDVLADVDICVSSAAAPYYVLYREGMEKIMEKRQGRELHLMDVSVPRKIDPSIGQIEGVHLHTVDDLNEITEQNMEKRYNSVPIVEAIILKKVDDFFTKIKKLKQPAQKSSVSS